MQDFLDERSAKFGNLQTLAKDMRVTFSGFLRGVKQGTLSAENCLRLAEVLGEEPAVIFRVANKPALADQFERLYGRTTNPMTEEERDLIDQWRALTANAREGLRLTLSELSLARGGATIPHVGTRKSQASGRPFGGSPQKRDGDALAELSAAHGETDAVSAALRTEFERATRTVEQRTAAARTAGRPPATPRPQATSSPRRAQKSRR